MDIPFQIDFCNVFLGQLLQYVWGQIKNLRVKWITPWQALVGSGNSIAATKYDIASVTTKIDAFTQKFPALLFTETPGCLKNIWRPPVGVCTCQDASKTYPVCASEFSPFLSSRTSISIATIPLTHPVGTPIAASGNLSHQLKMLSILVVAALKPLATSGVLFFLGSTKPGLQGKIGRLRSLTIAKATSFADLTMACLHRWRVTIFSVEPI